MQNGGIPCPLCNGQRIIDTPSGLVQACPLCDGTGADPGLEVFRVYTYDIVLTALQRVDNDVVVIDGGAAFRLKALTGTQTGAYRVRFRHASGEYMSRSGKAAVAGVVSNDLVNNANLIGTAQFPFPIVPTSLFGPAGNIMVDIEDLSNAQNTIQIALIGANVYPSPGA
jgi:hypothetical protein